MLSIPESLESATCPLCGRRFSIWEPAEDVKKTAGSEIFFPTPVHVMFPKKDKRPLVVLLVLGSLTVILGGTIVFLASRRPPQKEVKKELAQFKLFQKPKPVDEKHDPKIVQLAFQSRITSPLLSPSTAKFSSGYAEWENGIYKVGGIVDAQNKYGAMLRGFWAVDWDPKGKNGDGTLRKLYFSNGDICTLGRSISWEFDNQGNLIEPPKIMAPDPRK